MTTQRERDSDADSSPDTPEARALREAMVDRVLAWRAELGQGLADNVRDAMRAVPRHLFTPGASLEEAYADDVVRMKHGADGTVLSSVSAPSVVALMLDQLRVEPGHRVLEIGSGGYNAALLAELVGPDGEVTSVDIDPDVVARARAALAATGYDRVRVVCGDGESGAAERAPFDRIVVTVEAWDIPPAWVEQLAGGGRLVLPLRVRGLTRSVVLEREGDHLADRGYELCGFVPMQGAGERRERRVPVHGEPGARIELLLDDDRDVDAEALSAALAGERAEAWSGATVGRMEPFDDLDLWLASSLHGFCRLTAEQGALDRGLVRPFWPRGNPALVEDGGFAYRVLRLVAPDSSRHELGAYAHGSDAQRVADRFVEQVRVWDRDHRGSRARYTVHPAHTPDEHLPRGLVVDKRHTRITLSWP
ncbi:methyltransferase, FxLD system [Thermobifida halotolerans]|uniref:Protein-L-isoaspartate O-methyltransferase n=1 Tax=Thermobifida halotolerans TaxID=483545 RepID=A0A399FWT3_9ACTN|nr:methyltransferase, FxLD system [Thermobifida halotolerans]UOE21092.1 methyltransferase, FxLD system [Thermobifida halotolerans]